MSPYQECCDCEAEWFRDLASGPLERCPECGSPHVTGPAGEEPSRVLDAEDLDRSWEEEEHGDPLD